MKEETLQPLHPIKLATSATILTSLTTIFATVLAAMVPFLKTFTPILQDLYGPLGYNLSITGSLLGALYVGIDTFIITWLFAYTYNKLL